MENHIIESKAMISEGGRVLIPINIRKALKMDIGDEVILRVEEQEVHIIPLDKAVLQAQELIQKYNKDNLKLTDILSEIRKEDLNNE